MDPDCNTAVGVFFWRVDWTGQAMDSIKNFGIFVAAALAEIGGCYAFWLWLRQGQSPLWAVPGAVLLIVFAALLTLAPADAAGRAYAAYGGIYISTALLWLWAIERRPPDWYDLTGAALCICGAAIVLYGRRFTLF
jgi:small multidrug resistance family-3 protein